MALPEGIVHMVLVEPGVEVAALAVLAATLRQ
jgi:hypothetical protein